MSKINISDYEKELLVNFLSLIKDRYSLADEANFFLEQSGISSISVAIANQRDAVSHFVSFLSNPGTDKEDYRKHQLSAAEEHLRRAIIEPYQLAVDLKKRELLDLYEDYLTIPQNEQPLSTKEIDAIINTVIEKTIQGRKAKTANSWSNEWKQGVISFLDAFKLLSKTISAIKPSVYKKREQINLKQTRKSFITATMITLFLGILVGMLISRLIS